MILKKVFYNSLRNRIYSYIHIFNEVKINCSLDEEDNKY